MRPANLCFKSSDRSPSLKEALCWRGRLEGIAKAKAEGKYRGGIPTARAKAAKVIVLVDAGKTRAEAAEELEISIRSVFRILRSREGAEKAPVAPPVARIRARPQVGT